MTGAPDPANEQQWESPPIPASQGGGMLVPLPNGAKTRAVLLTAPAGNGQRSQLRAVRLLERLDRRHVDLVEVRVDPPPPPPIDQVARRALGSVEGGPELLQDAAKQQDARSARIEALSTLETISRNVTNAIAGLYEDMARGVSGV